jgi:hypothetical protein
MKKPQVNPYTQNINLWNVYRRGLWYLDGKNSDGRENKRDYPIRAERTM